MTASIVEQQRASAVAVAEAAAEIAPRVVPQPPVELAEAAEATLNGPVVEAQRPSFSSNQRSLVAAVLGASPPRAVESAVQPQVALVVESAQQAALPVESEALVAHLKLNSTPPPRSCRDRNWVTTVPAARAK